MNQKKLSENQQNSLRMLPGVDHVLELAEAQPFFDNIPKTVVTNSIRKTLDARRKSILAADQDILEEDLADARIIELVKIAVSKAMTPNLKHLVNATGVVVPTDNNPYYMLGLLLKAKNHPGKFQETFKVLDWKKP